MSLPAQYAWFEPVAVMGRRVFTGTVPILIRAIPSGCPPLFYKRREPRLRALGAEHSLASAIYLLDRSVGLPRKLEALESSEVLETRASR
jgi:hypothetical protein